MKFLAVAAAGAILACSAAAYAGPAASSSDKEDVGDANRVICRTEKTTGSRVGRVKRCMTAAQWAEMKRLDRQAIEAVQAGRSKNE